MSKKQNIARAIALGLLLSTPFYEVALAAHGTDTDSKTENTQITTSGTYTYTTDDATDATYATGANGENGGSAGDLTVDASITANISGDITITGTAGDGGVGSNDNTSKTGGGKGGRGGNSTVGITAQGTLAIEAQNINITAVAGDAGYGGTTYKAGGMGGAAGLAGAADVYGLNIVSAKGAVTAKNITIQATGGNGASAGSTQGLNGTRRESSDGGDAVANGLQVSNSNEQLTIAVDNISGTATGGNGGRYDSGGNSLDGVKASNGGAAEATGINLSNNKDINVTAKELTITAQGGTSGNLESSYGGLNGLRGIGGVAEAYGLKLVSTKGSVTATNITITATGGNGNTGGNGIQSGNHGSDGGMGGQGIGYGMKTSNSELSLDASKIEVKAIGGAGVAGGSGAVGTDIIQGGNGGKGGDGGAATAYGIHAGNSRFSITTDSIVSTAQGGAAAAGGAAGGSASGGTAGSAGVAGQDGTATAYGVYAAQGSVVTLAGKSGNTLDIGVTATGTDAKAYSVYADGATVLFDSSANINKKADLSEDNTVITHLNNATFGFTGTDADRTITGGTLNLQGSNTFIVNTDLGNATPTADKITFDSLAAGSSTATQYITVGYDPAIDPANLGSVDLSSNREIFEITNLTTGQDLSNFQAKTNVLDSALYKFTVTPEIAMDAAGNKLEISGITTAKLALPSESVMTAADTMTGMGNLWRTEGNNLMKRMGDLRSDPEAAKGGVWARYYRGDLSASSSYGRSLNQDYTAFQGGIDKVQPYHSGRLYTGIAVNHIDANSSYSMGRGEGSSTGVGLYTSWIGDKGHYVDVILRASRLSSNFKLTDTSGNHINADYSTWAYGISGEYGYRHKMQAGWFVEPQAELSFGHINGVSYTMSNGAKMDNSAINSLTARLGFVLGKEFKTAQRPGNVYLKGSLYHEFGGKGSLTGYYNNDYIHADGSPNMGTWYELGIGTNLGIAKNSNLYIDALKTFGGKINTKWQLNAGVRVNF